MTRFAGAMWRPGYNDCWLGARNLSCFRLEEDFSQTAFVASAQFQTEGSRLATITDWMYIVLPCAIFQPSNRPGLSPPRVRSAKKISVPVRAVVLRQIERFRSRFSEMWPRESINAHETTHLVAVWNPGVMPTSRYKSWLDECINDLATIGVLDGELSVPNPASRAR